jgi:endonuclease III
MEHEIIRLGKERFKGIQTGPIVFVEDEKANVLLNDITNNPHVFVLACLMDRQMKSERAWMIPQRVFDAFGTHKLNDLADIKEEKYIERFVQKKLHRFPETMAKVFYQGVQEIKNCYQGNAANIWSNKPSSALAMYRLLGFNGCGIKIASMAVNILARQFKVPFADYSSIEISPDVLVVRVIKRLGLVSQEADYMQILYKARELNPEFPGVIDFSCWEIGRKFCHPKRPDCINCIMNKNCKTAKDDVLRNR